jgi:hypothetical protein
MITIYIPSRSRWQTMKTLNQLSEELWPQTMLVVPPDQYQKYRTYSPPEVNITIFDGVGIAAKRQHILTRFPDGKFIMFDDDLLLYKRDPDGKTFHPISRFTDESVELVRTISDLLNTYCYVGATDKFMSHTRPRGFIECARFNQILAINRELLPQPWPQFRSGVDGQEEHDFHLQLLTRGCKTAITTEWSKMDRPGAKGGCSDWRNDDLIIAMSNQLVDFWPGLVSIRDKEPQGMYLKFDWRGAINQGLHSKK